MFGAGMATVATNPVRFFAPIGGWKSDVIINPLSAGLPIGELLDGCEFGVGSLPSALWGLRYWQIPANAGSWAGLERSTYPGNL